MLLGHPIVATPVALLTFAAIGVWLYDNGLWPLPVIMLPIALRISAMAEARAKYLAWKSDWDSYDQQAAQRVSKPEPVARPAERPRIKRPVLGGFLLVLLAGYFAAQADDPLYLGALIWLVGGTVSLVVCLWITRLRRKARGSGKACVQVCIARPLLSVPSIRGAYRALPDHCRGLLAGQSRATLG